MAVVAVMLPFTEQPNFEAEVIEFVNESRTIVAGIIGTCSLPLPWPPSMSHLSLLVSTSTSEKDGEKRACFARFAVNRSRV